jgi:hypothetical protein
MTGGTARTKAPLAYNAQRRYPSCRQPEGLSKSVYFMAFRDSSTRNLDFSFHSKEAFEVM